MQFEGSVLSPTQSAPPLAGAGLSHIRILFWVPCQHVTEQVPQFDQMDQTPSTDTETFTIIWDVSFLLKAPSFEAREAHWH